MLISLIIHLFEQVKEIGSRLKRKWKDIMVMMAKKWIDLHRNKLLFICQLQFAFNFIIAVRISFYRMSLIRRLNRAAASINVDVQTELRTFDICCTCRWNWFVCVFPFALAVEWLHRSIYVWALEMLQQHHPTQDFGARLIVYEMFHVDTLLRQRYRNFIVYAINAEAASNQVLRTFTYLLCTGVTMFLWLHWTYRFLPLHLIYAFSCFLKFGSIACARLRRIIE